MSWDPGTYLGFADERLRPGLDLMMHLPPLEVGRAIDLGCGTGALTARLARRLPGSHVLGLDSSPTMLARARRDESEPNLDWQEGGIAEWAAQTDAQPVDLIYSNAALHWLADHAGLFPQLISRLAPGGLLAVQMPRNFAAPSHQALYELARTPRWAGKLNLDNEPVSPPAFYLDLLEPFGTLDLWETQYQHVLRGPAPVFNWVSGTTLTPVKAALAEEEYEAFCAEYRVLLAKAYPPRANGTTLFTFRRLFLMLRLPH
jgi:trans-aconitate 2-methyltransferase